MRHFLRSTLFLLLTICTLTITAFADMGPKDQLTIKVENAPEELYYLDLLQTTVNRPGTFKDETLNIPLVTLLQDNVPSGWRACLAQPASGAPIFGKLTGTQRGDVMLHTFSYYGVPETYKIVIATESGEVWISDTYTRTVLQSSLTLDWETKSVTIPSTWEGYLLQFLATFLPTLLIEGALLFIFQYFQKRSWLTFFLVNLITQGALAVILSINALHHGVGWGYFSLFAFAEIAVIVVECIAYILRLKEHGKGLAVTYALIANLASAGMGWFLSEPVWQFVVSIS